MRLDAAVAFLNVGLKREKMALVSKGRLLAKLAKRLETDKSLVDVIEFAHQALDGDSAHVMQLLANIEYSMPV